LAYCVLSTFSTTSTNLQEVAGSKHLQHKGKRLLQHERMKPITGVAEE
jgi:hypothetical protein